jgi:aspartyl-tRNA(Asn)/glutamyl-tRNA(Gln) amidotransferase subunit A
MSDDDLAYLSASELVERYRRKTLSPVEATQAVLARIEQHNGPVNAFVVIDPERALADAKASEARWAKGAPAGLVDGVPTTIKDLVLTKGWPMRGGSRITSADPVKEDAPIVARLREQGAVLLGKTTTPEFGWKGVTDSPLTGVTRNPWDTSCTPGGSSGGGAVAAALGMGTLNVGSDGGGSIRIPSAFTGIFGHKPSFGRVARYPNSAFGTLSHLGPMTRTVADAALMLTVISRPDPRDWFSLPYDGADYRDGLEDGVAGLRIAFSPALGYAKVDREIAALVADAAALFEKLGATVEQADPDIEDPAPMFRPHWYAGAAFAARNYTAEQEKMLDPGLREVIAQGRKLSLLDYLAAVDQRSALGMRMNAFHETYDLLLTPTMPIAAFEAGHELPPARVTPRASLTKTAAGRNRPPASDEERWMSWTPFTYPFNLTQQPAATVPCGFTKAGLPAGLQIVGRMHDDKTVLRAARAFERERPFEMPRAPRVTHKG